jgi:Citrate transporter
MVPIAILSACLNNTPIVVVMIPFTVRWAKKIGVPKQQLLMPLSYATILGGTCTLVGTSTNLVVAGLLNEKYPNEAVGNIGLFDLAVYGVPNAMIGLAYMMACAPFLLPFRSSRGGGGSSDNNNNAGGGAAGGTDELLLGARVKPWSPAAGRSYKRSGLGNSGGIFLANVRRAATGNVHAAVSKDFIISVGDELYFTGLVEKFGEFCEKHGLEIITTDNLHMIVEEELESEDAAAVADPLLVSAPSSPSSKNAGAMKGGTGKDKEMEQRRMIRHLSDQIGGLEPVDAQSTKPAKVVVALDETEQAVLVGVDCQDRPGLLMEISDALHQQGLNL